jgi:[acyl-carrier-protein] S-malonyltransferase
MTRGYCQFNEIISMKQFAFVFPGQGSQSVGMLDAWGDNPVVMDTLSEASDALGEDIAKLIREGLQRITGTDDQYPACDVGGGCGCLPCLDG